MVRIYWVERGRIRQCKTGGEDHGRNMGLHWELCCWSAGGAGGITSVAVICVDISRNTGGEGGLLDRYRR